MTFCTLEIEYLGYILTRDGIKPQGDKVQAILVIQPPKGVKQLRHFLGMAQFYRDIWARRSDMLDPLTSLVGECGQTKVSKAKGTKKVPWHWDEVHQKAFDHVKATIAKEVVLAYPDFSKVFEIYTDASSKQLGAVITQDKRPIAFFSRKLFPAQRKYSVTKIELLAIVKTLKEFKGMLWGQPIKMYRLVWAQKLSLAATSGYAGGDTFWIQKLFLQTVSYTRFLRGKHISYHYR